MATLPAAAAVTPGLTSRDVLEITAATEAGPRRRAPPAVAAVTLGLTSPVVLETTAAVVTQGQIKLEPQGTAGKGSNEQRRAQATWGWGTGRWHGRMKCRGNSLSVRQRR